MLLNQSLANGIGLKVNVRTAQSTSILEKYNLQETAMSPSGRFVVFTNSTPDGKSEVNLLDLFTLEVKIVLEGKYALAGLKYAMKFSEDDKYLAIVESHDIEKSSSVNLYDIIENKLSWSNQNPYYLQSFFDSNNVISFQENGGKFAVLYSVVARPSINQLIVFNTASGSFQELSLRDGLFSNQLSKKEMADNNLEQSVSCKYSTGNIAVYSKYIAVQAYEGQFVLTRQSQCYYPDGWFKKVKKNPDAALSLPKGIRFTNQLLDEQLNIIPGKPESNEGLTYYGKDVSFFYGTGHADTVIYYAKEYKFKVLRMLGNGVVDIWAAKIGQPFDDQSTHIEGNYADFEATSDGTRVLLRTFSGNEIILHDVPTNKKVVSIYDTPDNLLVITPDSYYKTDKNVSDIISFSKGLKSYGFSQFDIRNNRPDIVIDRIGIADKKVVSLYKKAYLKRLKSLGLTEDVFSQTYSAPVVKVEDLGEVEIKSTSIKITASDLKGGGLMSIHVVANGVPLYGVKGLQLNGEKELERTLTVALEYGKNTIEVFARNMSGYDSRREKITAISNEAVNRDLYLFTLGVSKFTDSEYDLTYANKDANDIANLFRDKSTMFDQVSVKTYTDDQVTPDIIESIKNQISGSKVDDYVVIFVASHGLLDPDLNYYLAGHNTNFESPKSGGLSYDLLEDVFEGGKARNRLMMIDACHSGEVDKDNVSLENATAQLNSTSIKARGFKTRPTPLVGLDNSFELMKKLFQDVRDGTGSFVISAAGGLEYAFESAEWNNGVFTYALLNGIKSNEADIDNNGDIDVKELYSYISKTVENLTNGKQVPTTRSENAYRDFKIW